VIRAAILALAIAAPAAAQPVVGQPAPEFTATDHRGAAVRLSALRGRTVVLEWTNSGCPFVRAHYDSGTMQRLQADARARGVVWLSVNSGAPGKQGHVDGAGAAAEIARGKASPSHYLLDAKGDLGRLYGARTTPHMFVIGPDGRLAYMGAIDDRPTADPDDAKAATPHARNAIDAVLAGRAPVPASTRPYGCSVKYAEQGR
jgi:hypothetical protein